MNDRGNDAGAAPAATGPRRHGMLEWVSSVDHKQVAIMYLVAAGVFFLGGGLEALLMRAQLAEPRNTLLSANSYDQLFTMHGTTMIFLVVVPVLIGLATYFTPLMIGAKDVIFPRLNALSFWVFVLGGLLLYFSFLAGGAPEVGWFSYAPLSEIPYSSTPGEDYWALGLLIVGIGTIGGGINLIVTILKLRVEGMRLTRVPLFVWMVLVNSFLIVLAIPALNAALVMLLADRLLNAHFFVPTAGGSALMWQNYFWIFGHPEVYIMVLPAFGIISEVVPVFSRKRIFGYEYLAASTVAIGFLSFTVWIHHMFATGLGFPIYLVFAFGSMLIAIPTGVKIFNWVATMWGGTLIFTTSMLFAIAFVVQFTIGGLTGVAFAAVPIDWALTDTYFVVAHFHYTLFGGTMFAVFAGLYYWFPKISGRMLSEKVGKVQFWLTFIGFNTTFLVQHLAGLAGMPRRVFTYPNMPYLGEFNLISTIGAFILGLAMALFIANVVISLRKGKPAGDNPWDAWTLEWATTSPPPPHNFDRIPPVYGRRPLWDLSHPDNPDDPSAVPAALRT